MMDYKYIVPICCALNLDNIHRLKRFYIYRSLFINRIECHAKCYTDNFKAEKDVKADVYYFKFLK